MKVFVKTLEGTHFQIEVKPQDTVADVKKNIETMQGSDVYPTAQQMLTHQGKVLKDPTTLEENKVDENSYIFITLSKGPPDMSANAAAGAAGNLDFLRNSPQFQALRAMVQANPQTLLPMLQELGKQNPHLVSLIKDHQAEFLRLIKEPLEIRENVLRILAAAIPLVVIVTPEEHEARERGIPEPAELPPAAGASPVRGMEDVNTPAQPPQATPPAAVPSTVPNANPLDIFPQFCAVRAMVQANPELLVPMLQELNNQNPQLVNLIREHPDDFLRLINEPVEGGDNALGDRDTRGTGSP